MDFKELKKLIKFKNFTIGEIAIVLGMTREGLTRSLDNGSLKVVDLEKIAEKLQVDVRELFENENRKDKNIINATGLNQMIIGDNGKLVNKVDTKNKLEDVEKLRQQVAVLEGTIEVLKDIIKSFKQ